MNPKMLAFCEESQGFWKSLDLYKKIVKTWSCKELKQFLFFRVSKISQEREKSKRGLGN
jgi:hypothetical protein